MRNGGLFTFAVLFWSATASCPLFPPGSKLSCLRACLPCLRVRTGRSTPKTEFLQRELTTYNYNLHRRLCNLCNRFNPRWLNECSILPRPAITETGGSVPKGAEWVLRTEPRGLPSLNSPLDSSFSPMPSCSFQSRLCSCPCFPPDELGYYYIGIQKEAGRRNSHQICRRPVAGEKPPLY